MSKKLSSLTVVVRTGILEKAGVSIPEAVDHCDAVMKILSDGHDYSILVPDLGYTALPIISDVLAVYGKYYDAIIVIAKPKGPLGAFLTNVGSLNVLEEITGHPNGFALIFKNTLVKEFIDCKNIAQTVLSSARRILLVPYEAPMHEVAMAVYGKLPYAIVMLVKEPNIVIKFGLVGLFGSIVNASIVTLTLPQAVSINPLIGLPLAVLTGFELSLLFNFILHELWTFKGMKFSSSLFKRLIRLIKYHLSSLTSFITQLIVTYVLVNFFGLYIAYASLIGIALGFIANYVLGVTLAWRKTS
ncbi:MAG: GtrA family protein [Sulfolobales archaeon]|nr:GtrA family protein [Sulfolobales archaeon]MCX8199106.1 GtrA family protein [Sulfolobales archaeon]MDW8170085.1 GtrA family protein [Desulfurococcaceae archaeon]